MASRVQTLQRDQALATVQQNQFIVLTRLWGEAEGLLAGLAAVVRTLAAQFLAGFGVANDHRRPWRVKAEGVAYGVNVMALGNEGPELCYLSAGCVVSRHGVLTRHGHAAAQRQKQGGADCVLHR